MANQEMVGRPLTRADGIEKVTGLATYAGDYAVAGMLHAVLVQSTIAKGRVVTIDASSAESSSGFVAIFTHSTLPALRPPPENFSKDFPAERRPPLSDDIVHYAGQDLAIVLAETLIEAQSAASLVRVEYAPETPNLDLRDDLPGTYEPDHFATNTEEKLQSSRGSEGSSEDPQTRSLTLQREYQTPVVHHNPIEPYATVAEWNGEQLLLHDSTRWLQGSQRIVAHMLGISEQNVRVIAPYVGGAFGSKGFLWQHVAMTAQVARVVQRPVKLVLSRREMFTSIGHRPRTRQTLKLSADERGSLLSLEHATLTETSPLAHFVEPASMMSRNLYRTSRAVISHQVAPTNLATPCFMRAPGESPGMFALESAIDEMAEQAEMDPLEFRLRNYAESDLQDGRPWSSKHLRECYEQGARRFDWKRWTAAPRSVRRNGKLIGWGMATAAYPARRSPVTVRAVLTRDGLATFSAATHEVGCGTATVMEQIAADGCGLPLSQIRFVLGDSSLSQAPVTGASQSASSVGPAVDVAARNLKSAILRLVAEDTRSVFHGQDMNALRLEDGSVLHRGEPGRRESVSDVLARMTAPDVSVEGSARLNDDAKKQYTFESFGAHFAEVEVDETLGEVRIARWVSVIDGGRILNPKTARSQITGAIIFGLGMTLMEQTIYDRHTGAPLNPDLSEYLLPTCADLPEFDVSFVEEPDCAFDPLGIRGIGEIGITGVPAAIANAVYHATGVRIRDLPITPDKLIVRSAEADRL